MPDEAAILNLLKPAGNHLLHNVVAGTVTLYDGNLAAGNPRGSELSIALPVFESLKVKGLIVKTGGREDVRYEITSLGRATT